MSILNQAIYKTTASHVDKQTRKPRHPPSVWFDPAMMSEAAPFGTCRRRQIDSDAAIQVWLSINILFGLALRQTSGFAASLRAQGVIGLCPSSGHLSTGQMSELSMLSALCLRQKTLSLHTPDQGSQRRYTCSLVAPG